MDGKQAMCSVVTTLLVLAMFSVLPIDGQIICPWCDKSMQSRLLDCVSTEMISRPELMMISLRDIDNIKWQVASYSDSMADMPYDDKKLNVDKKFVGEIANVIKKNNYQNNHAIINVISDLAGNCYSSVTGYDPNVVTQDVKAMVKNDIRKSAAPLGGNPNAEPNSRMPYSTNQNQQSNFQSSRPQIQPPLNNAPFNSPQSPPVNSFDNHPFMNNAPVNPPGSSPVNSFGNPPSENNAPLNTPGSSPVNSFGNPPSENKAPYNTPGSPPANSFGNPPSVNNAPLNPPGSSPVNSFGNPPSVNNAPLNPPGSSPVNSFGNPSSENKVPYNPPGSPPANSFDNPPFMNNAPFNPTGSSPVNSFDNSPFGNNAPLNNPVSSPMNPSKNPSFVNNAAGPSENWPSNDYEGHGQARSDFSKNQAPSGGLPSSSLQNDKEPQGYKNSPDNSALASTTSPKISSPFLGSKSTDSDYSDNSNFTTPSPNTDASRKKTSGNEKSDGEEACDEKFKSALYEKLINDDRFCTFFGKFPVSVTKPEVPKIIEHAFKEYGIEQHYTEFSTFWRFESKTLNKESTVEDWDEVISKILKIIFSRNNLLKGDCEEAGKKMAGYILDTFPGDPAASSTENTNQNDGNDETSTESNSNSSVQKAKPASNSTANASAENNLNSEKSKDSGNPSFPELHSKLANIFKQDGETEQNGGKVPFSELLSTFETQENLEKLHRAAESCVSPSGFDFNKLLVTMTDVTDSIQNNHPDWSREKCQKEMYSATVAVLTKVLQDTLKASNKNAKSQSSSTQPDSIVDASDSQSSNSGSQPEVPNDYNLSSDDSTYPGPGTDFVSGSVPQPQQDFTNYGGYADGTGSVNKLPSGNQPGHGDWNAGLTQPSNFAPGPVNTNYGDLSNGNLQNAPFSQRNAQNLPPQDYPAGPPTSMKTQPYTGTQPFPARKNAGFQSPNFASDSGVLNPPNGNFGNNQFQADNRGNDYGFNAGPSEARPVIPNVNSQNFPPHLNQDYDSGVPAAGPNYNTQPQFNSNYNSRVPANEPVIPQW